MARKPKSDWAPTKYELRRNRWRASAANGISSRLVTDLQLRGYETALRSFARGRLVDLGCGNAPLCGIYRRLVDEYVWADWASTAHALFYLDHEVDLNKPLPFADAEFDTVLLSDVLEHIAEPDLLLSEIARILRPGGHAIIGVPFLYWIHEAPHDHHRYTKFKLVHFGEKHRLEVVQIEEAGGALDVWSDLTSKLLELVWAPLAGVAYYGWVLAKKLPVIHRVNTKAVWKFPLAYVAVYRRP